MSLSPPYSERIRMKHQPNPALGKGFHWPSECVEVFGHPWQRIFMCQSEGCRKGWEFRRDEMDAVGLFCHGDGTVQIKEGD